jgi:hypothetical protein
MERHGRAARIPSALAGAAALAALSFGGGCGPTLGPSLSYPQQSTAAVGVELSLLLHGATPDGSGVVFDFQAPDLPDLKSRPLAATLTNYAAGEAVWRWTPLAADLGAHEIDFIATGGGVTSVAPSVVTVTTGPGIPPTFREPAGEGTTLELARTACADVEVLVDDPDSTAVALALGPPLVPNALLVPAAGAAGTLHFCPSPAQVAAATVYPFTLTADDGVNAKVAKGYTIVVRPKPVVTCTTAAPAIVSAPHGDITTTGNLHIPATVSDDVGITSARVWWTTTEPVDPMHPDLNALSPIAMPEKSGDALAGSFEAVIPNPVVASPSGTQATIYYLVEADDGDPPLGCAHQSFQPAAGVYSFVVTRP